MAIDKLAGILSKYQKIKDNSEQFSRAKRKLSDSQERPSEESIPTIEATLEAQVEPAGLVPLPQPDEVRDFKRFKGLEWAVEPTYIDLEEKRSFHELGVSENLCTRLTELGFEDAFAVQTGVIPAVLEAQKSKSVAPLPDILVNSHTGSGKTLAYCVPIVDTLSTRVVSRIRALILVPTRPLLSQVVQTLEALTKGTKLHTISLRSDRSLARETQLLTEQRPDILVATPGRLSDHLNANPTLLADLKFLVVDEADRLLGQFFQDWTSALAKAAPVATKPVGMSRWERPPQRLIFSATLTRDPGKLSALQIRKAPTEPQIFVVGDASRREFSVPLGLHETLLRVKTTGDKPLALVDQFIQNKVEGRAIVFVRSNEAAARLARLSTLIFKFVYDRDVKCERCSGELAIAERKRALRDFSEGKTNILVCTDLIARGIDVKDVDCVVNYDLPLGAREYIHRVGRTARAGTEGYAYTICVSSAERKHFWTMQNEITRQDKLAVVECDVEADSEYDRALKLLESEVVGK